MPWTSDASVVLRMRDPVLANGGKLRRQNAQIGQSFLGKVK